MSQVYDEPIVVRLTQPVGPYPVGTEFGFKDVADAIRVLGSSSYFTVVRTQDGDPIPPPTPEDLTEAEKQALARSRAARLIRGKDFDPIAAEIENGVIKPEDGVFGVGVRRIIASTDPDHPLEDGDLLVLIEGGRFFTDFSEYATGAMPSDWQNPWVASTISVHEDAGNKMLRVVNAANQRTGMEWLKIAGEDQASDRIDIVYKWRQSKTRSGVRSVMRGGGSAGTENMYSAGRVATNSDLVIYRHNNGSPSLLGSSTGHGDPVDTWTISRFRMTPTGLYYREWVATDSEPSTWLTSYDAPAGLSAPPGWIGLTVIGSGTVDYDWIGVNTIGDPAPKGS